MVQCDTSFVKRIFGLLRTWSKVMPLYGSDFWLAGGEPGISVLDGAVGLVTTS